jgi:signal transduction histidine kinase
MRSLAYLALTPIVCVVWLLCCVPLTVFAGIPLGMFERRRLSWLNRTPVRTPHGASGRGLLPLLTEFATWSELFYGLLLVPLSVVDSALVGLFVVIPLVLVLFPVYVGAVHALGLALPAPGVPTAAIAPVIPPALLLLLAGGYVLAGCAAGHAYLARLLLGAAEGAELAPKVAELTRARTRVVRAFDSELKRIERDLHDGAQQRLTSVIMTLGMARYRVPDGSPEVADLVAKAQEEARCALSELRDLVRGIYPAVLRERGLGDALREISEANPVPVTAHVELARRWPEDMEAALYFATRELLANLNKHSGATSAELIATADHGLLRIEVRDNGVGGASVDGSGLLGVQDRMGAVGGTVAVASPPGGPTKIVLEMACA